jgi:glucuronosyltransferase
MLYSWDLHRCDDVLLCPETDWVEHVIATEGEPYLQTPEDGMSVASLFLLDVFAFLLVAIAFPIALAWLVWSRSGARQGAASVKAKGS